MSDERLRELERAARSRGEADCLRYWREAIRSGEGAKVRDDVVRAVSVERFLWAVPVLAELRASAGERAFKAGDWVRISGKRLATRDCYGRVVHPYLKARWSGDACGGLCRVEVMGVCGPQTRHYLPESLRLTVDPGPDGVIFTVAAEVASEKRRAEKQAARDQDDEPRAERRREAAWARITPDDLAEHLRALP